VCAEAFNPDDDEEDSEPRVVHPKTDEQRCRLQEACKDILLFKALDQVHSQTHTDMRAIKLYTDVIQVVCAGQSVWFGLHVRLITRALLNQSLLVHCWRKLLNTLLLELISTLNFLLMSYNQTQFFPVWCTHKHAMLTDLILYK